MLTPRQQTSRLTDLQFLWEEIKRAAVFQGNAPAPRPRCDRIRAWQSGKGTHHAALAPPHVLKYPWAAIPTIGLCRVSQVYRANGPNWIERFSRTLPPNLAGHCLTASA